MAESFSLRNFKLAKHYPPKSIFSFASKESLYSSETKALFKPKRAFVQAK